MKKYTWNVRCVVFPIGPANQRIILQSVGFSNLCKVYKLYHTPEQLLSMPFNKLPYLKSQKLMRLTKKKKRSNMILLNRKKPETEMTKQLTKTPQGQVRQMAKEKIPSKSQTSKQPNLVGLIPNVKLKSGGGARVAIHCSVMRRQTMTSILWMVGFSSIAKTGTQNR